MKYLFIVIITFILFGCNNNEKKTPKILSQTEKDSINTEYRKKHNDSILLLIKNTRLARENYGNDTIKLLFSEINLGDYQFQKNTYKEFILIESLKEANAVFSKCDSLKNINFDKKVLIGYDGSTNGFIKLEYEVLSIAKEKEILIKINLKDFVNQDIIRGKLKKWILINKPNRNWKIKVTTNRIV